MSLLEEVQEEPGSKAQRDAITVVAAILILLAGLWYVLRFHTEKVTVHHFMDAVVSGQMEQAYRLWKPQPSYGMKDFLDDWGPTGYYGPVKSYRITDAGKAKGGNEIIVLIEVSPYSPFPAADDFSQQSKTKEVHVWVQHTDQSLSFPP
jgi:hypothetical protein